MYSNYKTAIEYYKNPIKRSINYSQYRGPVQHTQHVKESYIEPVNVVIPQIKWEKVEYTHMSDPEVWGPAFWFTLHNGAAKYPISASPITKNRMKSYILGIPFVLPCEACKIHATNHIEKNKNNLDDICSGMKKLFKFFVDFHNIVNKRYNKPIVSLEDAHKMYSGGIGVSTMTIN